METKLFYFSGTGNSLFVAKQIKLKLNNSEIIPINNEFHEFKIDADVVGIIYPTYDLDAPQVVTNFVRNIEISSKTYLFIYVTSGGISGNSISSINKILVKKSIEVSNTFSVVFPDNSVILSKDLDTNLKILEVAGQQITQDCSEIENKVINKSKKEQKYSIKNEILGKAIGAAVKYYYQFGNIKRNDECNGCTICYKICPVGNISILNNKPVFNNNCEMCLGCIHSCPKQALRYKRMPIKKLFQYRHPEIELKELFRRM